MTAPSLRILCFGDSLTAGYTRWGTAYHPYRLALGARLAAAFPKMTFELVDDGVPGQLAADADFVRRMDARWEGESWDWTVVLGGTNDLGWGRTADATTAALQVAWAIPLARGGKVLALTVPECQARSSKLDSERDALNAAILGHTADNFHAFDLRAAIPYHTLGEVERQTYWDDGLHFTPEGYDWMGGHIADALVGIVARGTARSEL